MGRVKFLISAHIYVSVYHYVSDEQGSITHVLSEDAEILNHYSYDAFGNIIEKTEKVENRFCYNGEMLDPVTQQYYLRARFYNPVIGRFTQEDTYYGDGLNLYQYCQANPVGYVDPSGHNVCPVVQNHYEQYQEYRKQHPRATAAEAYEAVTGKDPLKKNDSSSLQAVADKAAQEYNAKYNPYERAVSKGYTNVKKTANGGVSFQGSEYMYYYNGQEARKTIQATGNRNNDFKMANQAMELVMDEAHNAAKPHSGGCAQYDSVNGSTYNRKKKGYK